MPYLTRPSVLLAIGLSLVVAATVLTLLGPGDTTSLAIAAIAGLGGLWLALQAVGKLTAPLAAEGKTRHLKWRIPPELDQPAPRRVRLKPVGWIAGFLWLIVALVLAGVGELGLPRRPAANLAGQLESTLATVAEKTVTETASGAQYTFTLAFTTARDESIRARVGVSRLTFALTDEGDTFEALYLPGDASRYVFPGLRRPLSRTMRYTLYGIGGVLLVMLEWIRRRERNLIRKGTAVGAEAKNVKPRGASRVYEAVFEAGGKKIKIPVTERSRTRAEGDLVTVVYLPENPERATVYETSFYRAQ